MAYTYEYPRPALTVDCVIFGWAHPELKVMLIRRGGEPFRGDWALPGGFVEMDESLEKAALRELKEETGLSLDEVFIEQLYTMGAPGRDPRGRVVSVVYYALVNLDEHPPVAGTDADDAQWFNVNELPALAFDHEEIMSIAIDRLRGKLRYQPIGFELMPKSFSMAMLQELYEQILGETIDKRNFRKKMLNMGFLEETENGRPSTAHSLATLYEFNEKKYRELEKEGFEFKV